MFCLFARICRHQFPKCDLLPLERSVPQLEIQILHFIIIFWTKNIPWNIAWNIPFVVELLKVRFSWSSIQRKECKMNASYKPIHMVCVVKKKKIFSFFNFFLLFKFLASLSNCRSLAKWQCKKKNRCCFLWNQYSSHPFS